MIYYERKEKKSFGFLIVCIFLIVIIYILVNLINKIDYNLSDYSDKTESVTSYNTNEIDKESLIKNSLYSIVSISKVREKSTINFSKENKEKLGMCSGIVISEEGYVLTNRHISGGLYSKCYVNVLNGAVYEAEVVWEDEYLDLAILKTNAIKLPSLSFANIEEVSLGENIFLISNYVGCESYATVQSGIISMLDNTFILNEDDEKKYIENVMKIDLEIVEENTGGAVINENGELLGIVSSENKAMIPISRIENVLNQLIKDKECYKNDLGIYGFGVETINYIKDLNLSHGVYIEKIEEDSILNKLIDEGEIITRIDGIEVEKMCEIKEYAAGKNKGETIIFTILRDNIEKDIEIAL